MAPIIVYESEGPLKPGEVDGMAEYLDDEPPCEGSWDVEIENPPYVPKDFDMADLPFPDQPHPKRWK
jgi:hypothetical protein